jgi:hypothetical protein
MRQKRLQVSQRFLRRVVPNHFPRNSQQFSRIWLGQRHQLRSSGVNPDRDGTIGNFLNSTA